MFALTANFFRIAKYQAPNRAVRELLRLVPPPPRPRRRLAVRINVLDGRSAFGSSRAFHLTESDVQLLIDAAMQMERRA
jgi:hypothetical protein